MPRKLKAPKLVFVPVDEEEVTPEMAGALDLMRQQHSQLGLDADLALAWHESGHAVTASVFGRLRCVQIESRPRAYFDLTEIIQNDDMRIAAMGPAAQLAYMELHQNEEPSSCFYDQWVFQAATEDLKKLSQRWPLMPLSVDEWHTRIHRLSSSILQSRQVSDALKLCAQNLLQKRMLAAEEVEHLVRDGKEAILHMIRDV
jgi:hypothetical protein